MKRSLTRSAAVLLAFSLMLLLLPPLLAQNEQRSSRRRKPVQAAPPPSPLTTEEASEAVGAEPSAGSTSPASELSEIPDAKPLPESTAPVPLGETAEEQPSSFSAASFQGVTPGITTAAELTELLGAPLPHAGDGDPLLIYQVGPFPKIEVLVEDQVVQSLVVHLDEIVEPAAMAEELGLKLSAAVPVEDEDGEVLGQAFPDRGVLFNFASNQPQARVAQVILEPVSAESFLLRAQHQLHRNLSQSLSDLRSAQQLDAEDARVYWLHAQLLALVGHVDDALVSADKAVSLDPSAAQYRLCKAAILAQRGDNARGTELTRAVLEEMDLAPEVQARAQCQLGDLLANSSKPDYAEAMKHHLAAIELATPLASDPRVAVRRPAKRVLVDAHLAVAFDVAQGNWRKKEQVVPQWLQTARQLAQGLVEHDAGDPELPLSVSRQTLACYAALQGALPAAEPAREAARYGQQLIEQTSDPLYRQRLQQELAQALLHAAEIERVRGQHTEALRYATNGLAQLKELASQQRSTSQLDHLLARLYFTIGSIYGAARGDHATAGKWFEEALARFEQPGVQQLVDKQVHGDRLISIGVSYWSKGDLQQGVRLTQQGIALLRQAVESGSAGPQILAIPYGNLASMHRKLGNEAEAKLFADLAARLETPAQEVVGRRVITD